MNFLVDLIIRPTRNVYNIKDLGDRAFTFSGQDFKRLDFSNGEIKNSRNQKINCSLWCPLDSTNKDIKSTPMIIYCHGNGGNKIDIIEIFEYLLWEFNLCSFDFSGAGYSEGDYVTLGFFEKYDIKAVVDFLRKEFGIKNIILYGRSMGAVSCLRYSVMDSNIKASVLDSPFSNFPRLCEEIISNKFYLPSIMSGFLIEGARKRILELIEGFDIDDFIPGKDAKNIKVPTILIHGKEDELVNISHSREIYKNINKKTYKMLLEVDGLHNDSRPNQTIKTIRDFMMQYSYDSLFLKEHRRRLNIKNAQLSFNAKYGIDISSIVENFSKSLEWDININNLPEKKNNHQDLILKPNKFDSKREQQRRLNNFNIDHNMKINKFYNTKNLFNKIISKSHEKIKKYSVLLNYNEENSNSDNPSKNKETDICRIKRLNSMNIFKNEKFYSEILFKDDNFCDFVSHQKNKIDLKTQEEEEKNNIKNQLINFSIENNPTKLNSDKIPEKDENNFTQNFEAEKNNKKYFCFENKITEQEKTNKSFGVFENYQDNFDVSFLSSQDIYNYTDLYVDNKNSDNLNSGKNKIKLRRNQVLSGILNSDVKLDSSQITITDLDKTSLRKIRVNPEEITKV